MRPTEKTAMNRFLGEIDIFKHMNRLTAQYFYFCVLNLTLLFEYNINNDLNACVE